MIYWVENNAYKQITFYEFGNWEYNVFKHPQHFTKLKEVSECLYEITSKDIFVTIYESKGFVWFTPIKENIINHRTSNVDHKFLYNHFFEMDTFDILCELSNQDML